MREIKQPEDVQPLNLFFEYYSRVPESVTDFLSDPITPGRAYEILNRKTIPAVPIEEVSQMINLAMDAEAYGAQTGNFEDAHKWRKLAEDLLKKEQGE